MSNQRIISTAMAAFLLMESMYTLAQGACRSAARLFLSRLLVASTGDRLDDGRIDGSDEIDRGVEIFLRDTCLQRPLDTAVASRLAAATQRHGQPDEHLLSLRQPCASMGSGEIIAKAGFSHPLISFREEGRRDHPQASIEPLSKGQFAWYA
jgi:hypothetical protein